MEQMYKDRMNELGYDQFVCDIFANWESVKDEILIPERKTGTGNGTIHIFLGSADNELRQEFSSYYSSVESGEDPSISAIRVTHYFLSSNVISMLGYVCQYCYMENQKIEEHIHEILEELLSFPTKKGLLSSTSLFKLSLGSNKLRPYFKQFNADGAFTKIIRKVLIPKSSYKISLYKNKNNEYAAFWLLGFDAISNFEADSSSLHLIKCKDDKHKENKSLILKNSILKNFILEVLVHLEKHETLESLVPYASASSLIKISSSNHGFALTGMFLDSTLEDVQSRNKGHIRWFEEPLFSINGKNVFLSTQWNSKGNYQLTLPDFKKLIEVCFEDKYRISVDSEGFFELWKNNSKSIFAIDIFADSPYRTYLTALRTKPFLLLAGISGTGKSRIVRELARACWEEGTEEYNAHRPKNFEMVQVKPNWHDSSELIGYVSRVSGKPEFIAGDFLRFVAKAWENPDVPHFLCLDEMNLAPVEQYFAEYLSVVESRKSQSDGRVVTDAIFKKVDEEWYFNLTAQLTTNEEIRKQFNSLGITIPQNLIVVGTVNMDETTFSFSRKVLDRAMTIEMNEVDLKGGLENRYEQIGTLGKAELIGTVVEGVDVYESHKDVCDKVIEYLQNINDKLEGTPFKIAYRTRNEFLLYVVNNLPYIQEGESEDFVIQRALDEITSMKILSRIEGDETKVSRSFLNSLEEIINAALPEIPIENSVSLKKLTEMKKRLESGYTSFWS